MGNKSKVGTIDIFKISPIYLRYFIDIYPISTDISMIFTNIFSEIPTYARVRYTLDISLKYQNFLIFHRNIGDFIDF